jgi:hypothetical protein
MTKDIYLTLLSTNPAYDYTVLSSETTADNNIKVYLDVSKELVKGEKSFESGKLSEHLDDYLCSPISMALYASMKEKSLVPDFDVYPKAPFSNYSSQGWSTLVVEFYHK